MYWIGRIVGAVLGWSMAGPLGTLVGFAAGYYFDRALRRFRGRIDPEQRQAIELAVFNSLFPLLGCLAKADGRVCEAEVQAAESMMTRMQLGPEWRQEAIRLFKSGAQPDFDLQQNLAAFNAVCGHLPDIKQMLLVYLFTLAVADGHLDPRDVDVLRQVARGLGYSDLAFEHLLRMSRAQEHFYREAGTGEGAGRREQSFQSPPREDALALAYTALGVEPSASDAEIKRAYRKLMSQYHPDKLMGQGVPEAMLKVATERAQEVQTAYDLIKKHRQ